MRILLTLALALLSTAAWAVEPAPSFAVQVTGKGKPVILIPGLSSSGAVWDGTVAHLKDRYECHVLTLAGFAGQPRIKAPFLETVRNDLAAYIKTHDLDHPLIIGHSLGGFLALWVASHDPDLTGPLVIVDSLPFLPAAFKPTATPENMKPMAEQMRAGMAKGGPTFEKQSETALKSMITSPENVELAMTWAKKTDPAAAGEAMYDMFTHDLRDDIGKIKTPALVFGTWIAYRDNDQDTATRAQVEKNYQSQYKQMPVAKIVITDTARHFIMLDDPKWFYAQLDDFLGK